ncbi:MAG: ATP-binding cassette domain-containing protein [Armatimonadota bacterium]
MTDLILDHVSKRFGARTVLRNVCAEVRAGEALVVTGHNGSGKSTLLTIIAGLLGADGGAVRVREEGRELEPEELRHRVSLVAPDLTLYPELTALENLEFFARVRGLPWSRAGGEALLERVGLAGRGPDLSGTFSSGMRVRLKYAVALQSDPSVLLLDEPTAMLDVGGARIVEEIIAEQRKRGLLVLATNDPDETRHGDLFLHLG